MGPLTIWEPGDEGAGESGVWATASGLTDGGDVSVVEVVLCKANDQTSLAHPRVPDQQQLEEVVVGFGHGGHGGSRGRGGEAPGTGRRDWRVGRKTPVARARKFSSLSAQAPGKRGGTPRGPTPCPPTPVGARGGQPQPALCSPGFPFTASADLSPSHFPQPAIVLLLTF